MNQLNSYAETGRNEPTPIASLDAQLTELIEFVWACETAARTEARIDAVIRYGTTRARNEGVHMQEVVDVGRLKRSP